MQNNYSKEENQNYAGFWVRTAAYIIDSMIVFIILLVPRFFWLMANESVTNMNVLFQYTLKDITLYILKILYFVILTWRTGTTVGKQLMNLRVISVHSERNVHLLDVLYRETIRRFLCKIAALAGYITVGIDKEKCGFHDMLCDTRVIYEKKVKIFPEYQIKSYSIKTEEKTFESEKENHYKNTKTGGYHLVKGNDSQIDEKQQNRMKNMY